jgi:hypothetical protein
MGFVDGTGYANGIIMMNQYHVLFLASLFGYTIRKPLVSRRCIQQQQPPEADVHIYIYNLENG